MTTVTASAASYQAKTENTSFVLVASCPERMGVVYAISRFVMEKGCTIEESQQYSDPETGLFFIRMQFRPDNAGDRTSIHSLQESMSGIARDLQMNWKIQDASERPRLLIMVSKYGHCLNDLLFRATTGWLNAEIVAVVSNHPDLGRLADNYDIPFHHIPVLPGQKAAAEARLMQLVVDLDVDLVVLARYMQILSEELCKQLEGRAINIHHSMLPSFKGARPYHQAHQRGVKFVGATAHYVTSDLDEGPIIEQQVTRISHALSPEEVTALGRDTESLALAYAVRWHSENRVLLNGHRTVVFP
jgi:formyltetrahydrofolate deformylase